MNKFHAQLAVNQEGVEEDMDRLVVECKCGAVFSVEVSCYLDTKIGCECGQLYGWFTDTDTLEALEEATERRQLLKEIATKPIRSFVQLDYFNYPCGVVAHDLDYDLFAGMTREFNRSNSLRLLIPAEGYTAEDVKSGVRLMLEWLESDDSPFSLPEESEHSVNMRAAAYHLAEKRGWPAPCRTPGDSLGVPPDGEFTSGPYYKPQSEGDKRASLMHNGVYRFNGEQYVAYSWEEDHGEVGAELFTLFDREGNEAFDVKEDGSLLPYFLERQIKVSKEVSATPAGNVTDLEYLGYVRDEDIPDLDEDGNVIPF